MSNCVLAKTATGEIQLTITIPSLEVKRFYEQALAQMAKNTQVPGFRKGKAPQKIVEEKVDKTKIYEQVLQKIVPQAYLEAIEKHQLKPLLAPKVELLKAKEDEDWEIRATTCERPEVDLGDYKEEVRKALAPGKIWTPKKKTTTTGEPESSEETEDEKTARVIQALLQTTKVDLPQMLIEDELAHALSNLINQTGKLGLTIDQYLASIGKSAEDLRAQYREKIENDLKLQLTLDKIAKQEKIEIKEEEVDKLIAATGDEKIRENLNSPVQRVYLKSILARRKTLDFLNKF